MVEKEALARISINKLLEDAGWRFFPTKDGVANVQLEPNVKLTQLDLDGIEQKKKKDGFVDYLLLDEYGMPFVVVEAKKEAIHPLDAKEQARKYANQLRCKYIILTNGSIHYFWNLEKGNPEMITTFPTYESLKESKALTSDIGGITNMKIDKYFVALSQDPSLENSSAWKTGDDELKTKYCFDNELRVLRHYQLGAIKSVQTAINDGKTRFLLEMATGTGKTLTSAGIIKMFIRSEVAKRVLFLVDRIELENQAKKDLGRYLSKDGIRVEIYKENKQDWNSADVIISTIQSFTTDNKYQKIFVPTDFDLVISDEAHRSIGGNSRAVFEYFLGYKLGLTATPKNYLKGVEFDETDPRELEKRIMLDTYHIFGCDSGNPTFSYTLTDGVKDGILVSPTIVDARTDITTELLSEEGLTVDSSSDNIEISVISKDGRKTKVLNEKNYEKDFFSEATNKVFCMTFMENALRDPITGATITPSDTIKVDFDGSQNYTIKASDGYKITSILVNGVEKLSTLENDVLTIKNPTEDTTIEVKTEVISYKFTEGKDAEYNGTDLTFKLDGLLELLDKVYINGELLSTDNYTTKSGSTIITLKDEYLKTLDAGTYDLKVTYTTGAEDTTTFKVNEKVEETPVVEENPKTSDGVLLYVGLGLISILGLTGTGLYIKKRFN